MNLCGFEQKNLTGEGEFDLDNQRRKCYYN